MCRVLLILCLGLAGCSLSDLRGDLTTPLEQVEATADTARAISHQVYQAYGGLDKWRLIKETTAIYTDSWPSWIFRIGGPWAVPDQRLRHSFWNGTFDSEMKLLNGPEEGRTWKISGGYCYKVIEGVTTSSADPDVAFYPPTYQYFMEFPYRLSEIPILLYGGDTLFRDQRYRLLFGTWETVSPNEKYDQYVIWVNDKTYLIDYLSYTIREKGASLAGTMNYGDFRKVQGVVFPYDQRISFLPGDNVTVHHIKVDSVRIAFR